MVSMWCDGRTDGQTALYIDIQYMPLYYYKKDNKQVQGNNEKVTGPLQ